MSYGHRYTKHQEQFLRENYKLPTKELCRLFNRKYGLKAKPLNLKAWLERRRLLNGIKPQFKKGHVPFVKGTKGFVKPNSGSFKKGIVPANRRPMRDTRIDTRDGYLLVKIGEDQWKAKHILNWERYRGPVPEGYVLHFKDEDPLNWKIGNMKLMTKQLQFILNRKDHRRVHPKLKDTVMAISEVEEQIHKKGKKNNERAF